MAGFDLDTFWSRTLRTVNRELQARTETRKREEAERARWVWQLGRLFHMDPKRFPRSPAALLPKERVNTAADWKVMDADALAWTVNSGGTVVTS